MWLSQRGSFCIGFEGGHPSDRRSDVTSRKHNLNLQARRRLRCRSFPMRCHCLSHRSAAGAQVARNTVFNRQPPGRCWLDRISDCHTIEARRCSRLHFACQRTLGAGPVMCRVRDLSRPLLGIDTGWWISVSGCSSNPLHLSWDTAGWMDALPCFRSFCRSLDG